MLTVLNFNFEGCRRRVREEEEMKKDDVEDEGIIEKRNDICTYDFLVSVLTHFHPSLDGV